MQEITCKRLLSADGWRREQCVAIDEFGRIASIGPADSRRVFDVDILVPAPANAHSHAFQRAMAGMTEARGPGGVDSFWTWRALMYRFLDVLTPQDVEAIAAQMQMESLESGFGSVVEFHYLHHQPGGAPYDRLAEMSERIVAAAAQTGCGLTLAPVLYSQGGCDGRPLADGQRRFGSDIDLYGRLLGECEALLADAAPDARLALAPHSLRAVSRDGLASIAEQAGGRPVHIHIAEQPAEVAEVEAAYGARPVEWLLANAEVDARWCLIHATHMTPAETVAFANTGAVAGLCPLTEANLGDGVFDGVRFADAGGAFSVGSDSNIQIDLAAELRQLDYSQRLRDGVRAALATETRSTGRRLLEVVATGGARASGRGAGALEKGAWADMVALDGDAIDLVDKADDMRLDAWIFAGSEPIVSDVWSGGRHVVKNGRHVRRDAIRADYRNVILSLGARL